MTVLFPPCSWLFGRRFPVRLVMVLAFALQAGLVSAQAPDSTELFDEDRRLNQRWREIDEEAIREVKPLPENITQNVDFEAGSAEFLQEENIMKGTGGVVVSTQDIQVQAKQGQLDLDTNDTEFEGDVVFSGPDGTVQADSIKMNLDSETGEFISGVYSLEDGAFDVEAERTRKVSEKQYEIEDCWLSTCHCADGSYPWKISSSEVDVTQEGYAHSYSTTLKMWEQPILYLPWLAFPVKQERQSGLLVPQFSYSNRDGVGYSQPIFAVIDDNSDMMFRPFFEARTRAGTGFDYRQAFSTRSSLSGRLIYSNESARDGSLRGTNTFGIFDPSIDEDRFGGYLKQAWSTPASDDIPLSVISDIHLVSDNLFSREIEDPDIALQNSRFTRSLLLATAGLGDYFSASVAGEYYQSFTSNQDFVLQRLPEFTLDGSRSFRPFGFNPFGLKVTPAIEVKATRFARKESVDGTRYNVAPSLKVPFHYKNYFNSQFQVVFNQTQYELDETYLATADSYYKDSSDRSVFVFSYSASTALERVYDLPEQSWLKTLTSLGSRNQDLELKRLKHTIEPTVGWSYVPGTNQDDLPFFDAFDRYRERSVITYGMVSRLWGSFRGRRGSRSELEELAPRLTDFWGTGPRAPIDDLDGGTGTLFDGPAKDPFVIQSGEATIRQLGYVGISQAYDYVEDKENFDPNRRAFSDVAFSALVNPVPDFSAGFSSNYDYRDTQFTSWALSTYFRDDRDDRLTARYSFIDDRLSQLEGNLEVLLSRRLSLGYYARYDDQIHDFIEQRGAVRFRSACDCWYIDLGVSDEINPDRQRFLLSFSFSGLGDINEQIGFGNRQPSSP